MMWQGEVFSLSFGYYSRLGDVPGKRYLAYQGKGVGTGGKVSRVPGRRYFLFQLGTTRAYTMYRGKGTGTGEKVSGAPGIKHFPKRRIQPNLRLRND